MVNAPRMRPWMMYANACFTLFVLIMVAAIRLVYNDISHWMTRTSACTFS